MNNKIVAYIGFALKSGKIIFGMDDIIRSKKNIGVILYKNDLSDKNLSKIKEKKDIPCILKTEELDSFEKLKGAKVIMITDKNLSDAIISNAK